MQLGSQSDQRATMSSGSPSNSNSPSQPQLSSGPWPQRPSKRSVSTYLAMRVSYSWTSFPPPPTSTLSQRQTLPWSSRHPPEFRVLVEQPHLTTVCLYHRNSFEMAPSSTPRPANARAASSPYAAPSATASTPATATTPPPPPRASCPSSRTPTRVSPTASTL